MDPDTDRFAKICCLLMFFFFTCIATGTVLYRISEEKKYVGTTCSCGKINYELDYYVNTPDTYNITYALFCPTTFSIKNMTLKQCKGLENCQNMIQYMISYEKTSLCCVEKGEIQDKCEYTVYGAIGGWFVFLGFTTGLLFTLVACIFWTKQDKKRYSLLKDERLPLKEVAIEEDEEPYPESEVEMELVNSNLKEKD